MRNENGRNGPRAAHAATLIPHLSGQQARGCGQMAGYSIFFRKSVERDLARIPKRDVRRIMDRILALAEDPRPRGYEKLSSQERYRVLQGMYRVVYSIRDEELTVWVVKLGHRRDVCR